MRRNFSSCGPRVMFISLVVRKQRPHLPLKVFERTLNLHEMWVLQNLQMYTFELFSY